VQRGSTSKKNLLWEAWAAVHAHSHVRRGGAVRGIRKSSKIM